jgi:hypothetical protein
VAIFQSLKTNPVDTGLDKLLALRITPLNPVTVIKHCEALSLTFNCPVTETDVVAIGVASNTVTYVLVLKFTPCMVIGFGPAIGLPVNETVVVASLATL